MFLGFSEKYVGRLVMSIHRFATDTGQVTAGTFDTILTSYRSEVEQQHTPLAIHDVESKDVALARSMAEEMLNVSGAELKVFIRTDNADFDAVWDEDPDPTYWNPIYLKGFFKPEPIETELTKWGADTKNKTEVVFTHFKIYQELGDRMLRAGDVIQLPYNAAAKSPKNYRVLNASPTGNFRYTWLYFTCQVETLTADMTVRPEDDMPVEEQIRTDGQYRESL
jgi:hypothetical protein